MGSRWNWLFAINKLFIIMKLIFESWKRFINESKIWEAEKLDKKAKGKTVYRIKHVPSGKTIPVQYYEGSSTNVKALAKYLNGKDFDGIDSKTPTPETLKAVHDDIINSKYKNPSYDYKKADEK